MNDGLDCKSGRVRRNQALAIFGRQVNIDVDGLIAGDERELRNESADFVSRMVILPYISRTP